MLNKCVNYCLISPDYFQYRCAVTFYYMSWAYKLSSLVNIQIFQGLSVINSCQNINFCLLFAVSSSKFHQKLVVWYVMYKDLLENFFIMGFFFFFLKQHIGDRLKKVHYFSDGCVGQYKNCKDFINLWHHKDDFN